MKATFRGFERVTPVPLTDATTMQGRLRVRLALEGEIVRHVRTAAGVMNALPERVEVERSVDLYGPRDVAGLVPGAIVRSSPPDGAGDVDGEYCVFVEFASSDLPWRYAPGPAAGDGTRPWIALVAGSEGSELGLDPDGTLWMSARTTADLDPAYAAAWAHTQGDEQESHTARLVCPRRLAPGAACLAAVVPLLDDAGRPRWSANRPVRGLPVYHRFRFTTNEDGTFEKLVVALRPAPRPEGLGEASLHADPGGGAPASAPMHGALAPRGPAPPPFEDPTVRDRVAALIEPDLDPDEPGVPAPVLGAPAYSLPFRGDPHAPWVAEVDTDPRHRAAAGLGARAAVEWQERITAAAAARLGQTHLAAALLRHLTGGVALARRTESRRPTDPAARLAFYGPALGGLLAEVGGTALDRVCPPARALAPAMLSTAAAHRLRASGPTAKASAEPDAVSDPGRVLIEALRCPPPVAAPIDAHEPIGGDIDVEMAAHTLWELGEEVDVHDLLGAVRAVGPERERDEPSCSEPPQGWLDGLVDALDGAFRADGAPVRRVVERIAGLHEAWDEPLEVRPDLDLPLWDWLRTRAPEWLLPRAGRIPRHGIVALRSDRAFVAALLIGASRQAVAELRWRGVPVSAGAMPMRTFWQHVASPENPPPMVDLVQPSSWPPLGLADLPGPRGPQEELVIAMRSDLVRRYPDTEVYLAPAVTNGDGTRTADLANPTAPSFAGRLEPDVWFFGFPVHPDGLAHHFLVLEEPDRGPRFYPPAGTRGNAYFVRVTVYEADGNSRVHERDHLTDGGAYAKAAYAQPIRAVCDGRTLLDPGEHP